MKRLNFVLIFILMAAVFALAFAAQEPEKETLLSVAIAADDGFEVLSDNPVTVRPGEDAVFRIKIKDRYVYSDATAGSYKDGILTVENVQQGQTVYLRALRNCNIELRCEANGSAQLVGSGTVLQGQTVTLQLMPAENYVPGSITVGSTVYPAPAENSFSFSVDDDTLVQVHFVGREISFLTVAPSFGYIQIKNMPQVYRYGDVLQLQCVFDEENIIFNGWSVGGYLADGGKLISEETSITYTLQENTALYANLSHHDSYLLEFDANGGSISTSLDRQYEPGAYINLPLSNGIFQRPGYTLTGFSTAPAGENAMVPGAMMLMPPKNTTLYAVWEKQDDAQLFSWEEVDGGMCITGILDKSVQSLVIPDVIDGKTVIKIADSAFQSLQQLQRVILPGGLQTVGAESFAGCAQLHTVYFPETITEIAETAFDGCQSLQNMRVIASLDRAFDYDFDSALADKYMRLKHTEGNRIILVGGSNLAFGMNSALLEERFEGYSVVNLGTSRHYGILPLFDLLLANVRRGDVVVFCPEYYKEMFAAAQTGTITNWQYLESNYDILKDMDLRNNSALLETFADYLNTKRSYLPDKKINSKPAYIRSGFNKYGDLACERSMDREFTLNLPEMDVLTEEGMARYNALCKQLTQMGAVCCFTFPCRYSGEEEPAAIKEQTASFTAALKSMLDSSYCTIISNIEDYYFSGDIFYDTDYHMTLEGADLRTRQLIADLARFLEVQ